MKQLSLLIKPASGLCNMRCSYCFYRDETARRQMGSSGIMSPGTASKLIDNAFSSVGPDGMISFSFQGGEPTLAGLPFFEFFLQEAGRRNPGGVRVQWAIQTNGLELDDRWADFLARYHFLVGLSVDGSEKTHDALRLDACGRGTYGRVRESLDLLMSHHVDTNLLCVVNRLTAMAPKETYRALTGLHTGFLQFIPCLDPLDAERGSMDWSLTPDLYAQFLCGIFDEWYRDWEEGHYTSVRMFDDLVHMSLGMPPSTCAACGRCGSYMVVESDGSVYPCDFYALDTWRLGSVQDPFSELQFSDTMRSFIHRSMQKPEKCSTCPPRMLCFGGCPRDWVERDGHRENYYCESITTMLHYIWPRMTGVIHAELRALESGTQS
ncbi:MAG: SPASM domain-containing protein [Clostridia bacterium]|nr:SPASM domain-containing protein [Clostridia bacterium]